MGPWLEILPGDPWLLTAVGILWGIMGIPLTPWWAWLGFRCGWQEGFALGWISALAAMTGHFLAFRMAGEKLRQTTWLGLKIQRFQPALDRFQADSTGLVWARLAWAIPFVVVNAWASHGPLGLGRFLVLSALAIAPNIAGVAVSGDVAAHWSDSQDRPHHLAIALGLFGLAGLVSWFTRRWLASRNNGPSAPR